MPTTYVLLPLHRYDSVWKGDHFEVGDRTKWTLKLHLSRISVGGSVTVVVEKSPTGEDVDWQELVTFGAQTSTNDYQKVSTTDFAIAVNRDVYLRARITSITGEVVAEVRAETPFFDITDSAHLNLVSKELRDFSDGRTRIIESAEEEVIELLLANEATGELDIDLTLPGASAAVRREVALQADHNRRREILGRSSEPSALVSLREMTRGVPGLGRRLRKFRRSGARAWLGR